DLLKDGEFDEIAKGNPGQFFYSQNGNASEMLRGDNGYFPNFLEYKEKMDPSSDPFVGENVIKVGRDQYWGHTERKLVLSKRGWEDVLRQGYNDLVRRVGGQSKGPSDRIPALVEKER